MKSAFSVAISDLPNTLGDEFKQVRRDSETLCAPLETEDYGIQTPSCK